MKKSATNIILNAAVLGAFPFSLGGGKDAHFHHFSSVLPLDVLASAMKKRGRGEKGMKIEKEEVNLFQAEHDCLCSKS